MTDFSAVNCTNLSKSFGDLPAVQAVNLSLAPGQFMALLGPSGCGKTTVLRLIAGLETPDTGTIAIRGRVVHDDQQFIPANRRRVGMVFQDYALFPHMTVEHNIAYGLPNHAQRRARVGEMLDLIGLSGLAKRYPHELSGGQQQRVALARALAPQPEILLLDEPFSNLDVALRVQVREDLHRILQEVQATVILVTHDQNEAISLADQIALMFDGALVQQGTPRELYERPVSSRAARFLGEANLLSGYAQGQTASTALGTMPLPQPYHGDVDILVRPESVTLNNANQGIPAQVKQRRYYGPYQDVWLELANGLELKARCPLQFACQTGDRVHIHITGPVLAFPQA